jgi:hypothetical protein
MNTRIVLSRININLCINKLLLRAKRISISDEKREGILQQAKDLNYVLETLKMAEVKLERLHKEKTELYLELQKVKREYAEALKKEVEI